MKTNRVKKGLLLLTLLIPVFLIDLPGFSGEQGVVERLETAPDTNGMAPGCGLPIPVPANIVKVDAVYQGGVFFTESRKNNIQRFRCTSCHNDKTVTVNNAAQMAHGNITVDHGGTDEPLACYTCHSRSNRDYLNTGKDTKIDLDHAYKLCGQCHFRQKKDWIGGAHGKRVTYWAGERVVKNCTSCHNPHSPRFEKRWPATYSVSLETDQGK